MKKAAFIITGLMLAIFVTGHFFIFKIAQTTHQNEFRAFILQHPEQTIKVDIFPSELYTSSENIKWIDDNKEVIIDNQVYDVAGFKNTGKTVSLFLMNDAKEKNLIDKYSEMANSTSNSSSKTSLIKDFLSLKYLQDPVTEIFSSVSIFTIQHPEFSSELMSAFITLENPPPVLPQL